jgi:hypothetical protein
MPPTPDKRRSINDSEQRKQRHTSSPSSQVTPKDQAWHSRIQCNPIPTQLHQKDKKGPPVIGADRAVSCMNTRARTVPSPINVATNLSWDGVSSLTIMMGITCSSTTPKHVPTKGTMRESFSLVSMPRRNGLKNGNGPDAFSRNSPVRGLGHWSDEIGTVGLAAEAEMERCTGSGVPFNEDSRINFPTRIRSHAWMGGDDTTLTPFSLSPVTDMVVDCLPALFLAYCMITDSDDVVSIDDRVTPWPSASDPVPLLTDWLRLGLRPWAYPLPLSP